MLSLVQSISHAVIDTIVMLSYVHWYCSIAVIGTVSHAGIVTVSMFNLGYGNEAVTVTEVVQSLLQ